MEKKPKHEVLEAGKDHKKKPARRKLLKSLAAGGTVAAVTPSKWIKPVVESTVLPAHAQASPVIACNATVLMSMFETGFGVGGSSVYVEVDAGAAGDLGCAPAGGDVMATLLFGATTLAGETVATNCAGAACLTSVSLFAYTTLIPPSGGDVTVRFTFPGNCTCSEVVTLAGNIG
jgi:hypothetical protein